MYASSASIIFIRVIFGGAIQEVLVLQLCVFGPTQAAQPFAGDGLVQERVCVPPQQLALHDHQSDHHPLIGQACVLQLCVLGPEQLLPFVQDRVCVPPQQLALHDHQSDQVGDGAFTLIVTSASSARTYGANPLRHLSLYVVVAVGDTNNVSIKSF